MIDEVVAALYIFWGAIGVALLLNSLAEAVRQRHGRVPVIDSTWWRIHDAVEWALHLPGRVLRWLRPRDTPRGLGGP